MYRLSRQTKRLMLSVATLLLGLGVEGPARALTTLTRDTRIDARHSIRDDVLVRADARGRSPVVEIVAGGSISGFLIADDRSTILLSGGSLGVHLIARESSSITMSGGSVAMSLFANDRSTVSVTGGSIGFDLRALDSSTATVSGGTIGADVATFHRGRITVSGGTIGADLFAFGDGAITLSGGAMDGHLFAVDRSTLRVHGCHPLLADPTQVALGAFRGTRYTLTGTPLVGAPLDRIAVRLDQAQPE